MSEFRESDVSEMSQLLPSDLQQKAANLSVEDFTQLLIKLHQQKNPEWQHKIAAVLVGLPYAIFENAIKSASEHLVKIFQQESFGEPLQHHLTMGFHQEKNSIDELFNYLETLDQEISLYDFQNISEDVNQSLLLAFEESYSKILVHHDYTKKLLMLAWNTNRLDLITKLSYINATWEKLSKVIIGRPRTSQQKPTGLYLRLEKRLNQIYETDNIRNVNALHDDEPSIEGLIKFDLWYIQDYWKAGLIPRIVSLEALIELSRDHHKELLDEVQKNLEKIGLITIKDLKEKQIFSKESLIEYIREHTH